MSKFTIYHDLTIKAFPTKVFDGISNPVLLDEWWTETCKGNASIGAEYELGFTQNCVWHAKVTNLKPNQEFELQIFNSHEDWDDTMVGFVLEDKGDLTKLSFYHSEWKNQNEHFRISSYCWAVYLRILKGYLEKGIQVPYAERDNV